MRAKVDRPSWGRSEWLMLAAAGCISLTSVMILQEPASRTPARTATQLLLVWLMGTMVVQRVAPLRILISLIATGMAAETLLEAAMLTGLWPAPVYTKVAAGCAVTAFGSMLFGRMRQKQRAGAADRPGS